MPRRRHGHLHLPGFSPSLIRSGVYLLVADHIPDTLEARDLTLRTIARRAPRGKLPMTLCAPCVHHQGEGRLCDQLERGQRHPSG